MIARLSRLSLNATPTPFHNVLRDLDDRKKLLRVYTQNIDALEEKAGLSFGLPSYGTRGKGKAKVGKGTKNADGTSPATAYAAASTFDDILDPVQPADNEGTNSSSSNETPRCIPLHGTLQLMHCVSCNHPYPLSDHSTSLRKGTLPDCPDCTNLEATRSMVGKRLRGIGKLRPSVVLYNEEHSNGEGVGEAVRRDLLGRGGADLLIVVGTSLRVPGTKRIVREFSKAVRAKEKAKAERAHEIALSKLSLPTPSSSPSSSPSPSPCPTPLRDSDSSKTPSPSPPPLPDLPPEERPISSIYVNLDFPVPTREWDNVFDVWVQGDAQAFAELVKEEIEREEREKIEKLEREERSRVERREREEKRRREKEEKERMKQEIESEGSASKVSKGAKKTGKKGLTSAEGKIEKKKRITVKVNSLSSRLPSTPKSLMRRTASSGRSAERSLSGRTITSSQTCRSPSPSKSRLSILSSLASQSPHVYRRRSAPEVVVPDSPYVARNASSRYGEYNGKGKSKENPADSRLDLLADAAATLSLSHLSRAEHPTYAAHNYGTPYKRGEPSTPRRSLSISGGHDRNRHSASQHLYQQPSPPDSRAHSHTRTWTESKSPKDENLDYCASSDSPLSSVSTLSSNPSPLLLASLPRTRRPRKPSLEFGRSQLETHTPVEPSVPQVSHFRSTSRSLVDPPIHDKYNFTRGSDGSSTPAKRKTDSVCTSPKAPSRVKKVKLNITRCSDAITHPDVNWSRNYQDNDTCHSISPKSSRDRCSHNSTDAHISDSEADADTPLRYALRSPRQEVLCN